MDPHSKEEFTQSLDRVIKAMELNRALEKICEEHSICYNIVDELTMEGYPRFFIEMPWTNSKEGTEGTDHIEVSSVEELYRVLGY